MRIEDWNFQSYPLISVEGREALRESIATDQ